MTIFSDNPGLLEGYRCGDEAALERVYRLSVRRADGYLRALAHRARAPELAQPTAIADLLQEVFIRVLSERSRQAYEGPHFGPYLNAICRNCFLDALRRRRGHVELTTEDLSQLTAEDAQGPPPDPRLARIVASYLRSLPASLRDVYEERFVQGSSQEVARRSLGITRRSLRTREKHLREGLRKALRDAALEHRLEVVVVPRAATLAPRKAR